MLKGTINLTGKSTSDLELAVEEALRLIKEGFTSGCDQNESGSYSFDIEGEEEPTYLICDECSTTYTEDEAKEQQLEYGSPCPNCDEKLRLF